MPRELKIKLIRGLRNLKYYPAAPSVVTIGAFDGLHLGHQAVLDSLKKYPNYRKVVILFEPLPKEFFSNTPIPRLSRLRDKLIFLDQFGVDTVLCLRFDQDFSEMTAENFIKKILIEGLNTKYLLIGDDFKFGFKQAGDFNLLKQQTAFETFPTPTFLKEGRRVASSWVRSAVMAGDFELAEFLLGRPYLLNGKVQHGDKNGRKLGFPTLNIGLSQPMAVQGVYEVRVSGIIPNQELLGVANVGTRPTFKLGVRRFLEVHLLDFNQDCYGKKIAVRFVRKIRDEKRFESLEALKNQIKIDIFSCERGALN